jgi:hypothetical protein
LPAKERERARIKEKTKEFSCSFRVYSRANLLNLYNRQLELTLMRHPREQAGNGGEATAKRAGASIYLTSLSNRARRLFTNEKLHFSGGVFSAEFFFFG